MNKSLIIKSSIKDKIYTIRGVQVILDEDLAELYNVSTKRLNEQVKRNIERFPEKFMFQLTEKEFENLKSQFVTSNEIKGKDIRSQFATLKQQERINLRSQIVTLKNEDIINLKSQNATSRWGGRRKLPYAFTEQGVAVLSGVLKSDTAIKVSIQIMNAFVSIVKDITNRTNMSFNIS